MPQSGFQVDLNCFLWDLVDEGVADGLDRIKGETGVTGLIVPVHNPAMIQFRTHPGVSPRTYVHDGGALFQPEVARYAGTRLRPLVSPLLRKSNPLKSVVQAASDRGLRMGCAVAACHCRPAAERYEHAGVRDVFGDHAPWLCPVNPDVQEYVRSLLVDLSENYAIDSVRLSCAGFPWSSESSLATRPNEHRGLDLGPVEVWLRSLCFCESCKQLAKRDGIDIDALAKLVIQALDQACRTGQSLPGSLEDFVESREVLGTYLQWRTSQMHRWLVALKSSCRCALLMEQHQESLRSGLSLHELQEAYDAIVWPCRPTSTTAVQESLARTDGTWDRSRVSMSIDAGTHCVDSGSLVAAVGLAAKSGCCSVSIDDYGSVPPDRLDWIRQAVRFARRESL